jgi:hypothetical protein
LRPSRKKCPPGIAIPDEFIAVKLYAGPALTASPATRDAGAALVAGAAKGCAGRVARADLAIDEHRDFDLEGLPASSARGR